MKLTLKVGSFGVGALFPPAGTGMFMSADKAAENGVDDWLLGYDVARALGWSGTKSVLEAVWDQWNAQPAPAMPQPRMELPEPNLDVVDENY